MKHLLTFLLLLSSISGFGQKFRYEVGGGYITEIHSSPKNTQTASRGNSLQSFSPDKLFKNGFYFNAAAGVVSDVVIFKAIAGYERYTSPYDENYFGIFVYPKNIVPFVGVKYIDFATLTPYMGLQTKTKIRLTGGVGLPIAFPLSQRNSELYTGERKTDCQTYMSGLIDFGVGYKGVALKAGYQFGISEMLKDSDYFTMKLSMFKLGITLTPQLF